MFAPSIKMTAQLASAEGNGKPSYSKVVVLGLEPYDGAVERRDYAFTGRAVVVDMDGNIMTVNCADLEVQEWE